MFFNLISIAIDLLILLTCTRSLSSIRITKAFNIRILIIKQSRRHPDQLDKSAHRQTLPKRSPRLFFLLDPPITQPWFFQEQPPHLIPSFQETQVAIALIMFQLQIE